MRVKNKHPKVRKKRMCDISHIPCFLIQLFNLPVQLIRKYFPFSYKQHSPDRSLRYRIQRNYVQAITSEYMHLRDK